jgi:CheY-like chemotaxis protein
MPPLRVLLADPDPAAQRATATRLVRLGHAVGEVGPGQDIGEACRRAAPDLIVLGVGDPAPTGVVALMAARQASAAPILLTAPAWPACRRRWAAAFRARCLTAPFDAAALSSAVADAVPGAANRRSGVAA